MDDQMQERVDYISDRFRAGKAAEFDFVSKTPTREKRVTITLIPEFLIKDEDESRGLLIVGKGQGSMTWDGLTILSPFTLVTAGFRPMTLAVELATLLNTLVVTARALLTAYPTKEPVCIGHDGVTKNGSATKRGARRGAKPNGGSGRANDGAPGVPKRRSRASKVGADA